MYQLELYRYICVNLEQSCVWLGRGRMQNCSSYHERFYSTSIFTFVRKNIIKSIWSWLNTKRKIIEMSYGISFGSQQIKHGYLSPPSSLVCHSSALSSPKSIYCSCRINTIYALGRGKYVVCKMIGMMIKVKMNNRFLFSSFSYCF